MKLDLIHQRPEQTRIQNAVKFDTFENGSKERRVNPGMNKFKGENFKKSYK